MRTLGLSLTLGLTALLAACSFSLTLPLPDQTLKVPAMADTQGQVVYPAQALTFPAPGGVVKGVRVEGTLEASQSLTLTLALYARTQDPENDPDCLALRDFTQTYAYACPMGPEDEKVGEATFTASRAASLALSGQNLTQGVQQGRLWLGMMASGLPAGQLELTFKKLKAIVSVGL
ncbi:hypothetical protein [Thermus igniterrae]|uniref:hypothetical protein n=1 Tax=Thermus igniterrae TaxID=88189 RepID=UPI00037D49EC|nr:hypothetical protein [Thermus igniterrae]